MIIDSHAHIGQDLARKKLGLNYNCDINTLLNLSLRFNISKVIVTPPPGQIICPNLGNKNHPNYYGLKGIPTLIKNKNKKLIFKCSCGKSWHVKDPFKKANEYMFKKTKEYNSQQKKVTFVPIPLIHPFKYKVEEDIKYYFDKFNIKGIKIHSLIIKASPLDYINEPIIETIKNLDLRILFHTDVDKFSHPEKVILFNKRTGIKCQLAHGARGHDLQ